MEETELVTGGEYTGSAFTTHEEIDAFCEIVQDLYDSYGMDVAIHFAYDFVPDPHIPDAMWAGGVKALCNRLHFALDADLSTAEGRHGFRY